MIVAKTKMKKIPKACNKCALSAFIDLFDKHCFITGKQCPREIKPSGNVEYTRPEWCPLQEVKDKSHE